MKVVALLSGGLDSVTMAYQLAALGHEVIGYFADYGQRAVVREQAAAYAAAKRLQIEVIHDRIAIPAGSALQGLGALPAAPADDPTQVATVVPARNLILLAHATAHAIVRKAGAVAYGATDSDSAIYPDCRFDFVCRFRDVLNVATEGEVIVMAPWVEVSKRSIAERARALGVAIEETWSCYAGAAQPCGQCGACRGREDALR